MIKQFSPLFMDEFKAEFETLALSAAYAQTIVKCYNDYYLACGEDKKPLYGHIFNMTSNDDITELIKNGIDIESIYRLKKCEYFYAIIQSNSLLGVTQNTITDIGIAFSNQLVRFIISNLNNENNCLIYKIIVQKMKEKCERELKRLQDLKENIIFAMK